ncbi:unnamed protein product [Spirodela intermedia]|uniref:HORMA domain-containing protein n=1 Tax=Spirodela intermedia TaxID=51605 RepID=A0A7I8JDX6_SPIIN|nr:unnamed protein product [Spirodela intermedia]CAA6668360.1 unnamed protein product [Spirodela intermedia]
MKIKKLMPMDTESRRLIDWMEKGVYDALQKKYLKTLLFCICENIEGPMIEEYSFSFSYSSSDTEEVSMNVTRLGNKNQGMTFKSNSTEITPDQMRSSACKMVRTLVQLMRTLDQMPDERTILMKLFYYDDVTPEDYEPPFFRCCSENEANNLWTKTPLKMEIGNVNSKHVVLALKVKSILDPCEDENNDIADDEEESMGACSGHEDGSSSSDGETRLVTSYLISPILQDQYIVAPNGEKRPCEDTPAVQGDDTQDVDHEEQSTARIREWITSRHVDTVELSEILSNFSDISLVITKILDKLLIEGLLSKSGKDRYTINRGKDLQEDIPKVKEEVDMPDVPPTEKQLREDHMYMKALYYALPMEYVSVSKLQNKLDGEANQNAVRKLIDRMAEDGFIQNTANKRLGRRVIHSESTNRKLVEVRKALERNNGGVENRVRHPFDFNSLEFPPDGTLFNDPPPPPPPRFMARVVNGKMTILVIKILSRTWYSSALLGCNPKDGSTCAALHSMGSELTRTRGRSDTLQNGSIRTGLSTLGGRRSRGHSHQQARGQYSSNVDKRRPSCRFGREADGTLRSHSTQDKRIRKASTVKEPIRQYVKRQRSQAEES